MRRLWLVLGILVGLWPGRGLALRAMVLREGQVEPKAAPVDLCSGERFRILVLAEAAEHRSYAYVVHGRGGKVALLYPQEGEPLRLQEGMQRIPEGSDRDDDAFFLDGEPGLEHLVLVSSREPLSQRAVERIADEVLQRSPRSPPPRPVRACAVAARALKGRLAPDGRLERYRGVVLRRGTKGHGGEGASVVGIVLYHR